MENTLLQILQALFEAHQAVDALRADREKLLTRIVELESQTSDKHPMDNSIDKCPI